MGECKEVGKKKKKRGGEGGYPLRSLNLGLMVVNPG